MELLSPRLRLREWSLADFQDFSRLAKNPNVMRYINNGKLWDDHRIRKFIERQQRLQKQMGHCLWVIELQQKEGLIGFCGIAPFEPPGFLEIGWWLDESCWGQGYATEAAKIVLRLCHQRAWHQPTKIRFSPGSFTLPGCHAQNRHAT